VITTAHSEADFSKLLTAFRESLQAWWMPDSAAAKFRIKDYFSSKAPRVDTPARENSGLGRVPAGVDQFPLTEAQKEIWLAAQMGGEANLGYNESLKPSFMAVRCGIIPSGSSADHQTPPDSAATSTADASATYRSESKAGSAAD